MSGFSTVTTSPSSPAGIVFLHGSGDSGSGFRMWIAGTHRTFFDSLSNKGVAQFSFPSAPERRYSLFGGEMANVWHDRKDLALTCPEDTEGVLQSVALVDQEIDRFLSQGVHPRRIFIFGLSMGGHLALQCMCYSKHRANLAGVVALSCFLSTSSPAWSLLAEQVKAEGGAKSKAIPPLCMMHGEADAMVPCKWGEVTSVRLAGEVGMRVKFQTIPALGHDLSESELQTALDWIDAELAAVAE
jgi:predicted esterase